MKASIVAGALFAAFATIGAFAGESSDRTYPKANCADRNANPADCVIQDGPPRRDAFGANTPPVQQPKGGGPRPNVPTPHGGGVSVLGGGK